MSTQHQARVARHLVVGGDWACAHNDIGTLRHIARELAYSVGGDARKSFLEIARLCTEDSELALSRWCDVRETIGHLH